jgi:uncharacterized membrane protein YbhN (UPF0104 family)
MDDARVTRFITPSAFFLASLFLGAWLADDPRWLQVLKDISPESVAMIAGATAAALFPLGFVITAVLTIVLRVAFWLISKTYQISLSEAAWEKVWSTLDVTDAVKRTRANEVPAAVSFDHEILHEGVHAAAVRLWSAFNIAAASCTALILALLVGLALHIKWTCAWLGLTGVLFVVLISVAVMTWRDHMGLLEFQSQRIKDGQMPNPKEE